MSLTDDDVRHLLAPLTPEPGAPGARPALPLAHIAGRTARLRRARRIRQVALTVTCLAAVAGAAALGPWRGAVGLSGPTPVPAASVTEVTPSTSEGPAGMPTIVVTRDAGCRLPLAADTSPAITLDSVARVVDLATDLLALPDADVAGLPDSATGGWLSCPPGVVPNHTGTAEPGSSPARAFLETHGYTPGGVGWSLGVVEPGDLSVPRGPGVVPLTLREGPAWWLDSGRLLVWREADGPWFVLRTTSGKADAVTIARSVRPAPPDDPRWAVYLSFDAGYHGTPLPLTPTQAPPPDPAVSSGPAVTATRSAVPGRASPTGPRVRGSSARWPATSVGTSTPG